MSEGNGVSRSDLSFIQEVIAELNEYNMTVDVAIADAERRLKALRVVRTMLHVKPEPKPRKSKKAKAEA